MISLKNKKIIFTKKYMKKDLIDNINTLREAVSFLCEKNMVEFKIS